jgi:hypothetical protein
VSNATAPSRVRKPLGPTVALVRLADDADAREHRRLARRGSHAEPSAPQALNYLLGQMEDGGYLRRREDPDDQRSKRIELTNRGHRAARAIREIVIEVEAEWEHELGASEFSHLRRLLTRLNSAVTPPRVPDGTGD